ncbi:hypothetical protein BLA29_002339 [Euroglyphus maynei]|uniref:Uncharacterized protein n=1 Tax=Euroglyphus maynei TaxID=6958 RepID=A0A1Y3B561_EURMA|nr:hypothetical protein BLA29_002339 [Euroglyphus maynei]
MATIVSSEKHGKNKTYKTFAKYINYLPRIIIYIICVNLFFKNSELLIQRYLNYETIVMVRYQTPQKIQFPAFTICGCCIEQIVQNDTAENILNREMTIMQHYTL